MSLPRTAQPDDDFDDDDDLDDEEDTDEAEEDDEDEEDGEEEETWYVSTELSASLDFSRRNSL